MVQYHGKITRARKKRKYAIGGEFPETRIGKTQKKTIRKRSGSIKEKMVSVECVNVILKDTKTPKKCRIVSFLSNPASQDFSRRNILTRGAILEVENGEKNVKVRVTSRPGQEGTVNAVEI